MESIIRHPKILQKEKSALLIIDIQEKILNISFYKERVIENTIKLIKGCKAIGLPIFYTEQYPQGLGSTYEPIKNELTGAKEFQKMSFSCSGNEELFNELYIKNIEQVIVAGIETHVCVQQTVLDLLANRFQVNVAADAVSSRKEIDYSTALNRMSWNGAEITTTEAILFELLEVCGTSVFKEVSKIVK